MITIRKNTERGHLNHGWLDTYHTFSFGDYHDSNHMGFRALRVINEDRVAAGQGFGTHPHRDMEIITYVLSGALEHRDSLGNGEVLKPGEVQRMSAGKGIRHSEFNPSATEPVHLLQIWILPNAKGIEPSYEQRFFAADERHNVLRAVVSPDGRNGSLSMHQDVVLHAANLDAGQSIDVTLQPDRYGWVQVARGTMLVNGNRIGAGDAAAIENEQSLKLTATEDAEFLLFDLN